MTNTLDFTDKILFYFTDHPNSTNYPYSYCEHFIYSTFYGFQLIFCGLFTIIHAIFPFLFPYTMPNTVVRIFKELIESNRHNNEILNILSTGKSIDRINNDKDFIIKSDKYANNFKYVNNLYLHFKIKKFENKYS